MRYFGRVFRPPSEARSLIVQVTYGCSHNTCAFCEMYKEKRFSLRPMEEIREDFRLARAAYARVPRIFLADGDAFMRRTADLEELLDLIADLFPERERVTCYASPGSIRAKTDGELRTLREKGLSMVYMGLESGCDAVLAKMDKGFTAAEIVEAGKRVRAAGMALSVTAISGLGGAELWRAHAEDTAAALSAMTPEYIGLLTLMVEPGTPLYDWVERGDFVVPDARGILEETALLLERIDSPGSVFRMNHASNYLNLRGALNADRAVLLNKVRAGLSGDAELKPEYFRAL